MSTSKKKLSAASGPPSDSARRAMEATSSGKKAKDLEASKKSGSLRSYKDRRD